MIRLIALLTMMIAPTETGAECETVLFDGAEFTACAIDVPEADMRLFLRNGDGEVYGSFARVEDGLAEGRRLGVAMNAGMFHTDRSGSPRRTGRETLGCCPMVCSASTLRVRR